MRKDVEGLIENYKPALAAKGPVPAGLLWPNASDLAARFGSLLRPLEFRSASPVRLLDLGCGPALLLDYLARNNLIDGVDYLGVDVFEETLQQARLRWPKHNFELRDVRDQGFGANTFDYCIICGVFTLRFATSYPHMEAMAQETLKAIWPSVTFGIGFNVMSKHVDWERDDLFHWPLDRIVAFCKQNLSRHVSLHLDYGLWETSVLVLKRPIERPGLVPEQWLDD